ncbi:MAG: efflux RND transporter permease subunit [Chitinispirillia bacterium]|jgi:multidrug efflux pump subunit AcrB
MNIGKFSVSNPVLVNILMIAILALGTLSMLRLPREAEPEVSFSWVLMVVPYPGASAEEVEKNVTIKIEDEISDIDNIKKITSTSEPGSAFLMVFFEDGISDNEFKRLYQDVRTEFDKVELPEGTLEPWIDDFSTSDMVPMITLHLKGDLDDAAINRAAHDLQDKLLDIKDISKAEIYGGQEREIWIEADRDKMEAFGISLSEISDAIKFKNMSIPGGIVETDTRNYLLRTSGQIKKIGEFGKIIVRRIPGKGSIRVKDIASVNDGLAPAGHDVRINGKNAISIIISKSKKGNSISLVNEVKKTVREFEKRTPKNLSISYFNDTSIFIRDVIKTLSKNALMGFLVLIIVLFLFIGFKNSLITSLGIPLTFAITFVFMEAYGETFNGSSLFALVMVLGMIVDHAIVIIENSYRHRQLGLEPKEAAIKGTNEVIKPVVSGTLTTLAAFLPLMLLPGIMGKFMRVIPIVFSLALFASTIEALFILPVHFAEWGSKVKDVNKGFFPSFQRLFRTVVIKTYKHKYLTLFITFCVIVGSVLTTPLIKLELFGGESLAQFNIDIDLPMGTPRSVTDKVASRFEKRIIPLIGEKEIVSISTTVGLKISEDGDWIVQDNTAQITVELMEERDGRERPVVEIMKELQLLLRDIPGAERVKFRKMHNGPPVEKPILFRLRGNNFDDLESIANDYTRMLTKYRELYNISHNFEKARPELTIKINEERATELGLNAGLIGSYIRNCFDGIKTTTFYDNDEEIDVIVKLEKKDRITINSISQMKIPTMDGRMIPFSTVCSLERGSSIAKIKRSELKREITVSADTYDKKNIRAISAEIKRVFNEKYKNSYPEISLMVGGEFAEFGTVLVDVLRLLGVGFFLMYLILGAQFKSFVQPFIIAFAIPFSAVGFILFLVISQTPFSLLLMYAAAALIGICVNDSIVLISFINTQRRKGIDIFDAVVEGAVVRLRPIILTSITTIAGLFPMAVGLGGKSSLWAPMASTIMFGLTFSTIGTLLIIPCVYGILDDFLRLLGKKMKTEGE